MNAINKMLVSLAFVVLLVLAAVITLAVYSNGFESVSPIYLSDGKAAINADMVLSGGTRLYLKRAGFDKNVGEYTVEVLTNPECQFDYSVNGDNYLYPGDLQNITEYFTITETPGGFEIEGKLVTGLLQSIHGSEVTIETIPAASPYILHIWTDYGEIYTKFKIDEHVLSIIVNPDSVLFYGTPMS